MNRVSLQHSDATAAERQGHGKVIRRHVPAGPSRAEMEKRSGTHAQ